MNGEMNGEQRERLRLALLRVLEANNTRFGLGAPALQHLVEGFGFVGVGLEVVKDEVDYLVRKELVVEVLKVVSRENRCWRITEVGVGFLDARN